jgi:hypothetical protein
MVFSTNILIVAGCCTIVFTEEAMSRRTWTLRDEYLQGGSMETRQECWELERRRRSKEWEELARQTEVHTKEDNFRVLQYQLVEAKRHFYEAKREILFARINVLDEQDKVRGMKPSIQSNRKAASIADKQMRDRELEYIKDEKAIGQLMALFRTRRHAENH